MGILNDLLESDIELEISCLPTGKFAFRIGDGNHEIETADTYGVMMAHMRNRALQHYPESKFAAKYRMAVWTAAKT